MLLGHSIFQIEYGLENGEGMTMVFLAVRTRNLVMEHVRVNFSSLRTGYNSASTFAHRSGGERK